MATFVDELAGHVRVLSDGLVALEKGPPAAERDELLRELLRAAHSLKGAARSVEQGAVESVCHRLEGVFARVTSGALALGADEFALLFKAVDAVTAVGRGLAGGEKPGGEAALAELATKLRQLGEGARAAAGGEAAAPPVPPSEAAPPRAAGATGKEAAGATVRVAADKLDVMLAQVGELLGALGRTEVGMESLAGARAQVAELRGTGGDRATLLAGVDGTLEELAAELGAALRDLRHAAARVDRSVHQARMHPFALVCEGLERTIRDLTAATGDDKKVRLELDGTGVELDRSVLEAVKDPLRHLVRNAVDHGVEPAAVRRLAGKPETATVRVSAAYRDGRAEIRVEDDGRGLDPAAIARQLDKRGLPVPDEPAALLRSVFLPGFSTATIITDISGRGVGLDVVRSAVEGLRGTVEVQSLAGAGALFMLSVPLTLTTLDGFLMRAGGQTLAVASSQVDRVFRVRADELRRADGRAVLVGSGAPVPVVALADVLGLAAATRPPGAMLLGAVVSVGSERMALVVDELLGRREIVVKSLSARVRRTPLVTGACILPSGEVALVLSPGTLLDKASAADPARVAAWENAPKARRRILVVEDSVTTRSLTRSILEAAGYEVATANDGEAAWRQLELEGADLLVTDVEMPELDGFELTRRVRASSRWERLPVVLLTGLERDEHKARGMEAGADAYLVKSAFDQRLLLETIAQLL
jgi:two-component system chemotaxis sensor kinase CheA